MPETVDTDLWALRENSASDAADEFIRRQHYLHYGDYEIYKHTPPSPF
jgi:hypothetical protein